MSDRIADTLVLTLPPDGTLARLREGGVLSRDWALVSRLAERYGEVVVLTPGGRGEVAAAEGLSPTPTVIANEARLQGPAFAVAAAERLADHLAARSGGAGVGSAVIKTQEMNDGGLSLAALHRLTAAGVEAALVARSSHLQSRFLARDLGADHPDAMHAGAEEARLCAAAHAVIGTTGHMVDELGWRHGVGPRRLHTVPNFVDDTGPVVSAGERDAELVLTVGRLIERKQFHLLVQALGQIPDDRRGQIRLEVVGDGAERPRLEAMAEELGVTAVFTGWLDHDRVVERMRRAALYVQASRYEGHPRAVNEAMATGCPVIVANTPGLGSIVENGVSGITVPGTADSFGYAITATIDDVAWREQLGSCAARLTRENLGLSAVVELEWAAHEDAMARAVSGSAHSRLPDAAGIRWDAALLTAPAEDAAAAWFEAMHRYAAQLNATERVRFEERLARTFSRARSA